jgi:hypothetical protein
MDFEIPGLETKCPCVQDGEFLIEILI